MWAYSMFVRSRSAAFVRATLGRRGQGDGLPVRRAACRTMHRSTTTPTAHPTGTPMTKLHPARGSANLRHHSPASAYLDGPTLHCPIQTQIKATSHMVATNAPSAAATAGPRDSCALLITPSILASSLLQPTFGVPPGSCSRCCSPARRLSSGFHHPTPSAGGEPLGEPNPLGVQVDPRGTSVNA